MMKLLILIIIGLVSAAALAEDSKVAEEAPAPEQAAEAADTPAATAAKGEDKEFEPPPGFRKKKHGKLTVYCMRDRTTGTRFTTEKCYDEQQLREYMLALEIQKRDIDRIRSTCGTASVCAPQ